MNNPHIHRTVGRTARSIRRNFPQIPYKDAVIEAIHVFRWLGRPVRGAAFDQAVADVIRPYIQVQR